MTKCMKCGRLVTTSSAFAVVLRADSPTSVTMDVVRSSELSRLDCVLHLNGDRECAKPLSGYLLSITEVLDLSGDLDLQLLLDG
jgi:hypothetical protein